MSDVQEFQEEILADQGYSFVGKDGEDCIWRFDGFAESITMRVKPNGDKIVVARDRIPMKRK